MNVVVMKFGGTSVEDATAILRTARIVAARRETGPHGDAAMPIVVVSAMSKVTDMLLAAAAAAGRGDRNGALAVAPLERQGTVPFDGSVPKAASRSRVLSLKQRNPRCHPPHIRFP